MVKAFLLHISGKEVENPGSELDCADYFLRLLVLIYLK
jgi:hypothetical protein